MMLKTALTNNHGSKRKLLLEWLTEHGCDVKPQRSSTYTRRTDQQLRSAAAETAVVLRGDLAERLLTAGLI